MSEASKQKDIYVIKVVDDIDLVINIGSDHGVKSGYKFLVYHVDENEMIDPITGESLGYLETVRGTGEATHVQAKMTTIRSNRKGRPSKRVSRSGSGAFSALMGEVVDYTEPEIISFESAEINDRVKRI